MELKTLQWNIGGGRLRDLEANPTAFFSYAHGEENLEAIAEIIKMAEVDIVTFQETHAKGERVQAKQLSELTGLVYYVNDVYDKSHLETGQELGQAILSRFPIKSHRFEFFKNPGLEMTAPTGEAWKMHNKGVTTVELDVKGVSLEFKTLHVFPYRKFGSHALSDEQQVSVSRESIDRLLCSGADRYVVQGDFNYDDKSLRTFLPALFEEGIKEVLQKEPTTPKGRRYDHVLYRGLEVVSSYVITDVLTDHFPIASVFHIRCEA